MLGRDLIRSLHEEPQHPWSRTLNSVWTTTPDAGWLVQQLLERRYGVRVRREGCHIKVHPASWWAVLLFECSVVNEEQVRREVRDDERFKQ